MLDQEARPVDSNDNTIIQHTTKLDGIRQKVFMDRYSLKDPDGNALEFLLRRSGIGSQRVLLL